MKKLHGWQTATLDEISKIGGGSGFPEAYQGAGSGDFPFIKVSDLNLPGNEKYVVHANNWVTEEVRRKLKAKPQPEGSIVFAKVGGAMLTNKRRMLTRPTIIDNNMMALEADNVDRHYLYQFMLTVDLGRYQQEGAVPSINGSRVGQIIIDLPPHPEQRKIADILTTWDEALSKLDALIAAEELRKKALMQRLLSRSSAHFKTSHAQHRLGDVMERVTRRNTVGSKNVLTISAQGGLVNQQEYFNRSVAAEDLSGYYLLRQGEFAYNRSSAKGYPFGAIKRLDNYDQGVVSTLYLCFRLRDGTQASSAYLCHYFEGGYLNSGLRMIAKEGARAHGLLNVTADEFFELDIFLPTLPEQQTIAEILDTADQQLTLLRAQRTALDQQKRGLMQRLLTGKLRVNH